MIRRGLIALSSRYEYPIRSIIPGEKLSIRTSAHLTSLCTTSLPAAPYAMRTAKQILNRTLQIDLASALELERSLISRMATPEEMAEARREAAERSSTYANIFSKQN